MDPIQDCPKKILQNIHNDTVQTWKKMIQLLGNVNVRLPVSLTIPMQELISDMPLKSVENIQCVFESNFHFLMGIELNNDQDWEKFLEYIQKLEDSIDLLEQYKKGSSNSSNTFYNLGNACEFNIFTIPENLEKSFEPFDMDDLVSSTTTTLGSENEYEGI